MHSYQRTFPFCMIIYAFVRRPSIGMDVSIMVYMFSNVSHRRYPDPLNAFYRGGGGDG